MALVAKKNEVRTNKEKEILAKNLIILSVCYEEIKYLLDQKRDSNNQKKYPRISNQDALADIMGTDRSNLSKLCHMNKNGSVTKNMVFIATVNAEYGMPMVLSDEKIWYKNDDMESYDWKGLEENVNTKKIIEELRGYIRKSVINIDKYGVSEEKSDLVFSWLKDRIIKYYEKHKSAIFLHKNKGLLT